MLDWNPDPYLKFEKERTLPAKDLISRIDVVNPKRYLMSDVDQVIVLMSLRKDCLMQK